MVESGTGTQGLSDAVKVLVGPAPEVVFDSVVSEAALFIPWAHLLPCWGPQL